jgi:hypothetical protein
LALLVYCSGPSGCSEQHGRDELRTLLDLEPRCSEIEEDRGAVAGADQNVVGGDVEVAHPIVMHEFQRAEQRAGDTIQFLLRGWPADVLEPAFQRAAGNEVEQHVDRVVCLQHAANIDDVGMTELREETRLVEELAACPLVVGVALFLASSLRALPSRPGRPGRIL